MVDIALSMAAISWPAPWHTAAGLGNAMGSVVSAARNNTLLLITAGQQTRAMLPTDPYLCSPRSTLL
jgi:benzoylformate decarboxylase